MTQNEPNHHGPEQPHHAPGGTPLPDDLSKGWLPEDKRQTPPSPLPPPSLWKFQSLLPFKAANAMRHPGEMPILIAAYAVTLVSYVGLIIFFLESVALEVDGEDNIFTPRLGRSGSIGYLIDEYFQQFLTLLVLGPIVIFIGRAINYAQQRVRGIRMSPTQFPEGYQMVVEAAHAAGLRRVPDAYVISGNGTLNAFAAGHGHRRFICVYSDMFEVGGKTRDPEALRYVIGHEVGHIAAGHVGYFRMLFTATFRQLPVLGMMLSRAQEYTADNYGYRLSPDGARGGMKVLAGGKYLNKQVNFDEFADRAVTDKGLAVWFVNLLSSHPVLTWRAHAIRNRQEPGRLVWRPTYNPPASHSLIPASEPVPMWPDPLQSDAFMQEQKPAWQNYSLDTVQLHTPPNPQNPPAIEGTLYAGWQDAAARAAYAARWQQYAANAGQQPVWQPPQGGPNMQGGAPNTPNTPNTPNMPGGQAPGGYASGSQEPDSGQYRPGSGYVQGYGEPQQHGSHPGGNPTEPGSMQGPQQAGHSDQPGRVVWYRQNTPGEQNGQNGQGEQSGQPGRGGSPSEPKPYDPQADTDS